MRDPTTRIFDPIASLYFSVTRTIGFPNRGPSSTHGKVRCKRRGNSFPGDQLEILVPAIVVRVLRNEKAIGERSPHRPPDDVHSVRPRNRIHRPRRDLKIPDVGVAVLPLVHGELAVSLTGSYQIPRPACRIIDRQSLDVGRKIRPDGIDFCSGCTVYGLCAVLPDGDRFFPDVEFRQFIVGHASLHLRSDLERALDCSLDIPSSVGVDIVLHHLPFLVVYESIIFSGRWTLVHAESVYDKRSGYRTHAG